MPMLRKLGARTPRSHNISPGDAAEVSAWLDDARAQLLRKAFGTILNGILLLVLLTALIIYLFQRAPVLFVIR